MSWSNDYWSTRTISSWENPGWAHEKTLEHYATDCIYTPTPICLNPFWFSEHSQTCRLVGIYDCHCFTGTLAAGPRIHTQNEPLQLLPDQCRGPWEMSYQGRECWQSRLITKIKDTHPHKITLILTALAGFRVNLVSVTSVLPKDLNGGASLRHLAKTCFLLYPLAPTSELL